MTSDGFAAAELTTGAAIAITVVSLAMARVPGGRIRLAVALTAWFGVVVALGTSGALSQGGRVGAPLLGLVVVLPVLVMAALTFATSRGRLAVANASVPALIALNVVRIEGISLVLLHAADRLPAPFAPMAGWGDVTVGVTAPLVAWMAARRRPGWRLAALAWNTLGLLDLVDAIGLGVASAPGPLRVFAGEPSSAIMSTLPWLLIPGFLVPLLAFTHIVLLTRLTGSARPHLSAAAA